MRGCGEELCRNWSGDGMVCPCAVFGLEPDVVDERVLDAREEAWMQGELG